MPNPALLLMDFQRGIVARFGDRAVIERAREALALARRVGMPVIFVRVAFRAGYPEVSPRNRSFAAVRERPDLAETHEATQIDPALEPRPGETVVVKRRVGAFSGSDLDVVLRSMGITDLVLGGISTSGVVLSTVRAAADQDYGLTVLADACADADPEVHRVLLEKVFPRQAEVLSVDAWAARWPHGASPADPRPAP